jgi:hypothetical protein
MLARDHDILHVRGDEQRLSVLMKKKADEMTGVNRPKVSAGCGPLPLERAADHREEPGATVPLSGILRPPGYLPDERRSQEPK